MRGGPCKKGGNRINMPMQECVGWLNKWGPNYLYSKHYGLNVIIFNGCLGFWNVTYGSVDALILNELGKANLQHVGDKR